MSYTVTNAEAYQTVSQVFTQVNFTSWDFNSLKQALLNYLKLYYPENFNDFIESDEMVAMIELFAYVGELFAYRIDMNASENMLVLAQRKDNVLRTAKMLSYQASRNIPARGLVKINSVQTTATITDSNGVNLGGQQIIWNDANNSNWKEQFLLVMNQVLSQQFGSVAPSETFQVDDVLFQLYTLNNNPLASDGSTVFEYSTTVTGTSYPMELVPCQLDNSGPSEKRPESNAAFALLYANDGLGDGSNTTGFLIYTKQGSLQKIQTTFDGITPNQTFTVAVNNINETDVWLNNVDPTTDQILTQNPSSSTITFNTNSTLPYGAWTQVNVDATQNILFNTNPNFNKYEIETLNNDQIMLVFGNGELAAIPSGTFDVWFRTSANQQVAIPSTAVANKQATFTYQDDLGNTQTFTFTFSLVSSLLNAAPSESITHIQNTAPSVYYSQDRMVNGRDYNSFMLQDTTILLLTAINRTFTGDSEYIAWYDPKEYYQNVKIFGDDLALYWLEQPPGQNGFIDVSSPIPASELVVTYIEPILCSTDIFGYIANMYSQPNFNGTPIIRCQFKTTPYSFQASPDDEYDAIVAAISSATSGSVELWYSAVYDEWTVGEHYWDLNPGGPLGPAYSVWLINVIPLFSGSQLNGYTVQWASRRLIAQSSNMQFWNANTTGQVVDLDTLATVQDYVAILAANIDSTQNNILGTNIDLPVISQEVVNINTLPNAGLPDPNRINVITEDTNNDTIPDNITLPQLFNRVDLFSSAQTSSNPRFVTNSATTATFTLLQNIVAGQGDNDVHVYTVDGSGNIIARLQYGGTADWIDIPNASNSLLAGEITINNTPITLGANVAQIRIDYIDYVYFYTPSTQQQYEPVQTNDTARTSWAASQNVGNKLYVRYTGRYPFNFAWYHFATTLNLIDPASSNIIDMFIITSGFYQQMQDWLSGNLPTQPVPPTPLDLSNSYSYLLQNKMISDTVILHSGNFKILFGSRANPQLQATFLVVRPPTGTILTDNEVKVRIVTNIQNFFNLSNWSFGSVFNFAQLQTSIMSDLRSEISSVVIVPLYPTSTFGDLFQIQFGENEVPIPDISTSNISIVPGYTSTNLNQS